MLDKVNAWVAIIATVISLAFGGGWYQEYAKGKQEKLAAQERLVKQTLRPIKVLLDSNKAIYEELQTEPYKESGWGTQDSYLIKIRKDGVKKNAVLRAKIDTLDKNNQAMITLLQGYVGSEKTEAFRVEARAFIDHANRYRDRWSGLIEIFESDGNFPTAEPVFPKGFPSALEAEIAAVESGA